MQHFLMKKQITISETRKECPFKKDLSYWTATGQVLDSWTATGQVLNSWTATGQVLDS